MELLHISNLLIYILPSCLQLLNPLIYEVHLSRHFLGLFLQHLIVFTYYLFDLNQDLSNTVLYLCSNKPIYPVLQGVLGTLAQLN